LRFPLVTLAEVATIQRDGVSPEAIGDGTRYLGLEHIESGGRIIGGDPVEAGVLASTKFAFAPTDVLYGKLRPYLAKIALPDFSGVCSTDIVSIRPSARLDRRYLAYFLRQPVLVELANSRATGANLPRLSPKELARFEIPLPPLEEQKRIAAILDQADALRRVRARALDRLNSLGHAVFHEMFGEFRGNAEQWPTVPLGNCVQSGKIGLVRGASEQGDERPVRYIRMDAIGNNGSLDLAELRKVDVTPEERIEFGLHVGDLLFNTRNSRELVGKTAVVRRPFDGVYNNNILRLRMSPDLSASFLDAYLRSPTGRSDIDAIKSGTTSVFAVYQRSLMELKVPMPPQELQMKFSDALDRILLQTEKCVVVSERSDRLFISLQHRAFRGEL
jgi:type I restriction enzyme S subunit